MDLMTLIKTRRSVRKFTPEPVDREILKELVEAAVWAPTGGNAQTWRFVVVSEPGQLRKVKIVSPGMAGDPAAIIVIAQDMAVAEARGGDKERHISQMDSAMAAQNLMLAAWDKGLGTCVVASFHAPALAKVVNLPEHIKPQLVVSIGHSGREPKAPARKLEEITWWESYDE